MTTAGLKLPEKHYEAALLELYSLDYKMSPSTKVDNAEMRLVSKRTVNICLRTDRSTHCHRPIMFEFFAFSMVSVTIHASLIAGRTIIRKMSVDTPISEKLRNFHNYVCRQFIKALASLKEFMRRYSHVLTSPLKIPPIECETEAQRLSVKLASSDSPLLTIKQHVDFLSNQLCSLFGQLLQLYGKSKEICLTLMREFDQMRFKQLSEAFLFSEDTVQVLLSPAVNQTTSVLELIKKSDYLEVVPKLPVYVNNVDIKVDDFTIILEQRFLPSCISGIEVKSLEVAIPSSWPMAAAAGGDHANLSDDINSKSSLLSRNQYNKKSTNGTSYRNVSDDTKHSSKSLKFFEFCLPIGNGRRSLKKFVRAEQPFQYDEISPNSLLLKGGNFQGSKAKACPLTDTIDRRRMTDPGTGITTISTVGNVTMTDRNHDSDLLDKAKSLNELLSNVIEVNDLKNGRDKSSSSSSKITTSDRSGSTGNSTGCLNDAPQSSHLQLLIESRSNKQQKSSLSVDDIILEFVRRKELFKQKLQAQKHQFYLYSDAIRLDWDYCSLRLFNHEAKSLAKKWLKQDNVHLIVFVHGLEGSSDDLMVYRNYLKVTFPDSPMEFLLSCENQRDTWLDFEKMADRLQDEIYKFIWTMPIKPNRISFVAHSLGGIIVRTLCNRPKMGPLLDKLHTIMTLNSPHCGLLFNQRAASWGLSILQWWKQSACIEQLMMRDAANIRDTFLYRLSMNGAFGMFKNVLLVGSMQDLYVPGHSALVEPCKASLTGDTDLALVYGEMLSNFSESIVASPRHTTLIRYTVAHAVGSVSRAQQVTGRAIHIAAVEDDTFVEKLILVSASKYFE